jgi:hypothetical protein
MVPTVLFYGANGALQWCRTGRRPGHVALLVGAFWALESSARNSYSAHLSRLLDAILLSFPGAAMPCCPPLFKLVPVLIWPVQCLHLIHLYMQHHSLNLFSQPLSSIVVNFTIFHLKFIMEGTRPKHNTTLPARALQYGGLPIVFTWHLKLMMNLVSSRQKLHSDSTTVVMESQAASQPEGNAAVPEHAQQCKYLPVCYSVSTN